MDNIVYQLGLEELAMSVSLAGSPQAAKGMLVANLGELDTNEEHGRLMAANHSLMAKGLLVIEDDGPRLQPDFEKAISVLTQYDYTLRFSIGSGASEEILAFYAKDNHIVKHENRQGVVHILSFASGIEQIVEDGAAFFHINEQAVTGQNGLELEVRYSVLEEARQVAATTPRRLTNFLEVSGVPRKIATMLAEDLIRPEYRGSVMRVELVENRMVSDYGFLVLKGQQRAWFFPIVARKNEPYARIVAGTKQSFKREIQVLMELTNE
ncbi:hypothetical protein D6779_02045 [Candidatus Parcubacteria bacterium]|nr:MAG: hypothetical protein D6779_02045 [Candidatus Parcubacteria bacterium]